MKRLAIVTLILAVAVGYCAVSAAQTYSKAADVSERLIPQQLTEGETGFAGGGGAFH